MVSHECSWTSRTCRQTEAQGCGRTVCRSSRRHARCLSLADLFFFFRVFNLEILYHSRYLCEKILSAGYAEKGMPIAFPSLHTPPPSLAVPRLLRLRASQIFEKCTSLLWPASQARSSGRKTPYPRIAHVPDRQSILLKEATWYAGTEACITNSCRNSPANCEL